MIGSGQDSRSRIGSLMTFQVGAPAAQGASSALNEGARLIIADGRSISWLGALNALLRDNAPQARAGQPVNGFEPRLPCHRHELLPPAPFAELLRRAFAPDLRVRAAIAWLSARESPTSSEEVLAVLRDWQLSVLTPLADHLDANFR